MFLRNTQGSRARGGDSGVCHLGTPPLIGRVWSLAKARDKSREFNVLSQDTLLKLDDGSHLHVMGDSDLTDVTHHHAWFEGEEVALPREDRVYLLGNLTGQTPKRRRVPQSRSDLKDLNVACSFPVERATRT